MVDEANGNADVAGCWWLYVGRSGMGRGNAGKGATAGAVVGGVAGFDKTWRPGEIELMK